MSNSWKEVIKSYLFEGADETKREKFELSWDFWKNFEEIKREVSQENILEPLKKMIENLIKDGPYRITYIDWTNIYFAKPEWKQKEDDRGIYALCIEKRDEEGRLTVGIVRNKPFTTSIEKDINEILLSKGFRKTQWWVGYIPIRDWNYGWNYDDLKKYYLNVFFNPQPIVEFLFGYFEELYRTVKENPELEDLLDKSVRERKSQLSGSEA